MSRIGRLPIEVPAGVDVKIQGSFIEVKGPKGTMSQVFPAAMKFTHDGNTIHVERSSDERQHRSWHGMSRAILANMINGVTKGFTRVLQIEGVGYRAEMREKNLVINIGFSHEVVVEPPAGITFAVDDRRIITISGFNKQAIGQVAADIRKIRPPEPYQGKGIRYTGEKIQRKAGKTGKK